MRICRYLLFLIKVCVVDIDLSFGFIILQCILSVFMYYEIDAIIIVNNCCVLFKVLEILNCQLRSKYSEVQFNIRKKKTVKL